MRLGQIGFRPICSADRSKTRGEQIPNPSASVFLAHKAVPSSETDPDCSWPKLQSGPSVFTRIARFKSVF